jgi:5-methylcytosine-specific restriction endonuclease McrA
LTKKKIDKPYNHGTMTNAGFWGMIRSALRQKSRWWKPISETKKNARRKYNGKNKRQKWEYQCNHCNKWFPDKNVQVDHIVEAGTLRCKEDVGDFIERLFCEIDGFQVLCKSCHKVKTDAYKKELKNK